MLIQAAGCSQNCTSGIRHNIRHNSRHNSGHNSGHNAVTDPDLLGRHSTPEVKSLEVSSLPAISPLTAGFVEFA